MKKLILLFVLTFSGFQFSSAQSFKDGLQAYEIGEYEKALQIFLGTQDQQHQLFAGKSLYNLNKLHQARFYLNKAVEGRNFQLKADAYYTLASIFMIENNPAKALDYLFKIETLGRLSGNISNDAKRQISTYNSFLSFSQRVDVLRNAENPNVLQVVLKEGVRVETKLNAASLVEFARNFAETGILSSDFVTELESDFAKKTELFSSVYPNAPEGFSYTIGVFLTSADKNSDKFVVSKSLYQGLQTAVEEYNTQFPLNRVFLTHTEVPDSTNSVATSLFDESVDLLIGPLTSDDAKTLVPFAEDFMVPMIAPLANNDSLNVDNPYFFQMNPAFRTRGIKMAEYAIKHLNVDTVAIMVDRNTMGYLSALAFKEEMERKNVHVAYFFAEKFEESGFDISESTKYFTSDPILRDSLDIPTLDLIYMPFTGAQSETLIDLTLTDLEAAKSKTPIIGSQDWAYIELTPERLAAFTIYFPDAMLVDEQSEKVIQFRQNFKDVTQSDNPDVFSYLGYDIGTYTLQVVKDIKNPTLFKNGIKFKPAFKGIGNEIYFNGTHVNQILSIFKMDKNGISKVSN